MPGMLYLFGVVVLGFFLYGAIAVWKAVQAIHSWYDD